VDYSVALFEAAHDPHVCLRRFANGDIVTQHWPKKRTDERPTCRYCLMLIKKVETHAASRWAAVEYIVEEEP